MVYNYRLAFKPTTPLIFLKRLKERKNKDEDSSLGETIKGGLNILCLFLICLLLKALPCSNEPSLSTNLLWGSRWFYTQPKWWSNHTWWFENWSLPGLHKDTCLHRFAQGHKPTSNPRHRTSCLYFPPWVHLSATGATLVYLFSHNNHLCSFLILLSNFPIDNSLLHFISIANQSYTNSRIPKMYF